MHGVAKAQESTADRNLSLSLFLSLLISTRQIVIQLPLCLNARVPSRFYVPSYQRSALSASKQHGPIAKYLLGTLLYYWFPSAARLCDTYFDRFDFSNSNEDLTTVLHSSPRVEACYVTYRRGEGGLNCGCI
jgi:hypothetical protein